MPETGLYDRLALALPGSWIDHTDRDYAWAVHHLLHLAVDQFNDAVVACQFFQPIAIHHVKAFREAMARRDPLKDRLRGIYSRAYVYALCTACSAVKFLMDQPLNSPPAKTACDAFLGRFQDLRHIRNSVAHIELRSQAIGYGGKKLPGPVLVIGGALINNRFGVTSGDGRYVEVEISEPFLERFRSALLEIIWSFDWIVIGDTHAKRP